MSYIGYEYKELTVSGRDVSLLLDGYESFGWQPDENRPAPGQGRTVTLYLKRDRKIINKMELTRLQRNFEACLRQIDRLRREPARTATAWALFAGLVGTAFMAGAVFAVTHTPPHYLLMTALAVPAFGGWAAAPLLYPRLLLHRQERLRPALDAQYEQIWQLCEKGQSLL